MRNDKTDTGYCQKKNALYAEGCQDLLVVPQCNTLFVDHSLVLCEQPIVRHCFQSDFPR